MRAKLISAFQFHILCDINISQAWLTISNYCLAINQHDQGRGNIAARKNN